MPATRHTSAARRGAVLVTAALVPALMLPTTAAAVGGPVSAQAATGVVPASVGSAVSSQAVSSQVVAGQASAAAAVSGPAAAAPTIAVRQPRVTEVRLSGIDAAVGTKAPDPDDHGHGSVGALSAGKELKLAVAAKVPISAPASLVAVTARKAFPAGTSIQVRVKEKKRGWSDWTTLAVDPEHGPDPESDEARRARPGSDPLMVVRATKAQIRIDTPSGRAPKGVRLALVNAPTSAADRRVSAQTMSASSVSASSLSASATVSMPAIVTRAQWGADESWRSRAPYYTDNIRVGFIHHTASTSNYSAAQAAAQIRSIYAYHTRSLGHSDIDYNFVVDRFGRLYEGRYGGVDRAVLGGHTAGFNEHSFAAVVLGNFDTFSPPSSDMDAIRDTLARLWAWKLGMYGINPASTVQVVSAGFIRATRYPKGSVATLTATSTHQTVNFTSCPGKYLQAQVPSITALGSTYSDVVIAAPTPPAEPIQSGSATSVSLPSSSTRAVSWTADILSPCSDAPIRTYTGSTPGAGPIDLTWDLRDASGKLVLPATYTVRMSGTQADGSPAAVVSSTFTIAPKPGGTWGPCANASRVSGSSAAQTSVLWGRISAPTSQVVVLTGDALASSTALSAGVAAAPLARSLGAPLLVTSPTSLASDVVADIKDRRPAEILVVGGDKVISPDVFAAVSALGFPVTRVTGGSAVGTAAAVADRMGSAKSAVVVSTTGSPAHSLAGAALAAARGVPVLLGTTGPLPSATVAALAGRTSVTVAAPASVLSDADVAAAAPGKPWDRLMGTDAASASTVVAAAFPGAPSSAMVLPETPGSWATATVAASTGAPLLFTTSPVLAPAVADHIRANSGMRATTTTVDSSVMDDQVLGATSRLLLGLPWAPPGVTTAPTGGAAPTGGTAPSVSTKPSPTGKYRLARANATPEPVRKGRTLKVKSKVKAKFTNGKWRKVPIGVGFIVQYKAKGKKYRAVASGYTVKGWASASVKAKKSGRWRIKIGTKKSKSDYVRVKK